ncbi:MAG: RNA methyltransferase [Bacillota bacterium]
MTESGHPDSLPVSGAITSVHNERIKRVRKLARKKHRKNEGQVLVEGVRTLRSALAAELKLDALFCSREFLAEARYSDLLTRAAGLGAEIFSVSEEIMKSLATVATSQGVVGVAWRPAWTAAGVLAAAEDLARRGRRALLLWFDRLSDPGNLGTIIRTAHGLGAAGYFSSPDTVEAFNPRSVRAAAGSSFFLPGAEGVQPESMLSRLTTGGYLVVAAAARGGVPLRDLDPTTRMLLLVGEEAGGLSDEMASRADVTVTIPMTPEVESLNVAAAAAIILHHVSPLRS